MICYLSRYRRIDSVTNKKSNNKVCYLKKIKSYKKLPFFWFVLHYEIEKLQCLIFTEILNYYRNIRCIMYFIFFI